jgi:hypothetical protein
MRKVKLDDQSGKSADAFSGDENPVENEAPNFANSIRLSEIESKKFAGESKSSTSVLKQIFLFLPGTFLLFYMSFAAAMIAVEIIVFHRRSLPDDFLLQFALIGSVMVSGTLMTWLGLGNIKNKKHFAIPASIIVTGAMLGAIIRAAAKISDFADRMLDDFDYLIFLFPLALIVPVLAKGIVDRKSEDV